MGKITIEKAPIQEAQKTQMMKKIYLEKSKQNIVILSKLMNFVIFLIKFQNTTNGIVYYSHDLIKKSSFRGL